MMLISKARTPCTLLVHYLNNSIKYVSNVFPLLDEVINVDVMIDMIELGQTERHPVDLE